MYGLMRAGLCSSRNERAYQRRLHYCGTCKTMGRLYGQKTRFLLNHDTVFLAELLTALSPNAEPSADWHASFQSLNCFSLPESSEVVPLPLQISAATTLVMTEFKVADQLDDNGSGKWKLAQRVYSQSFCEASKRMKEWGFPLAGMWNLYQSQRPREVAAMDPAQERGAIQTLEYVAEPTATVTGWTFQHAAAAVGAETEAQQRMYQLGFTFGRLVYVLDALDDFGKDLAAEEFNALQAAFRIPPPPSQAKGDAAVVPDAARATTTLYLEELAAQAADLLRKLPLPEGQASLFADRLRSNLDRRINPGSACTTHKRTFFERLQRAAQALLRFPSLVPVHASGPSALPAQMSEEGGGGGIPTSSSGPHVTKVRRGCCCDGCDCDCADGCCCACEGCDCCASGSCCECGSGCGDCCGSCGECGSCCS
jgi:hypothetical protein